MNILFQSFAVGVGAFFGGCLRSILSTVLNQKSNTFKWGTIMANLIGSCFLGVVIGAVHLHEISDTTQLITAIGFSGGLTTFSTFTSETFKMFHQVSKWQAWTYWCGSVIACMLMFFFGLWLNVTI